MVATVKIIPFAVKSALVDAGRDALRRAARPSPSSRSGRCKVGLVQTVLPGVKDSVLAKTVTRHRGAAGALGQPGHRRAAHRRTTRRAVAEALTSLAARQRHGGDVRRVGDERSRRRHPGGDPAGRRRGHARRHAGRSRQSDRARQLRRQAGDRRAGLRAQPQGERLRLGARPADRRASTSPTPTSPAWASAAC